MKATGGRGVLAAVLLLAASSPCLTHPLLGSPALVDLHRLGGAVGLALGTGHAAVLPVAAPNASLLPPRLLGQLGDRALLVAAGGDSQLNRLLDAPVPTPRAILILVGAGNPRVDLARLLPPLRKTTLWDANAVFVVVPVDQCFSEKYSDRVQRALTRQRVFRAVGVGVKCGEGIRVVLYASDRRPARPPVTSNIEPVVDTLGPMNISDHSFGVAMYTISVEDKLKCRAGNIEGLDGIDPLMVTTLAKAAKVRPLCYSRRRQFAGVRLENGTYTGLLRGLVSGKVEFIFTPTTAEWRDPQWRRDLETLYPHILQSLCAYVRRSDAMPFLKSAMRELSTGAWTFAASILVALAMARIVIGQCDAVDAFLVTGTTFITGIFPRRTGALGVLSLGTSFYGLVMLNAFQSFFTSILTAPRHAGDWMTLQEVDDNVESVYTYSSIAHRLAPGANSPDDDAVARLARKMVPSNRPDEWFAVLPRLLSRGDRALLLFDGHAVYFRQRPETTRAGRSLLHRVPDCVLSSSPVGYAARRHSPYARRLDALASRLRPAGLPMQFLRRSEVDVAKKNGLVRLPARPPPLDPYSLATQHTAPAFAVLAAGLLLAAAVGVLESWTEIRLAVKRWPKTVRARRSKGKETIISL